MAMDPLDRPNVQGPNDRMPGAPKDRSLTHLGRQFDSVLGARGHKTTGLPQAYGMSSHWDDVDTFDERQPMRRMSGVPEGGAGMGWGGPPKTEGVRMPEAADILPRLVQRYGMGYRHAMYGSSHN